MAAICKDYYNSTGNSAYALGCNSNLITAAAGDGQNTTGETTGYATFSLTFGVYSIATSTGSVFVTPTTGTTDGTTAVAMNFSNTGIASGTLACNLASAYVPRDGGILVDGTQITVPSGTLAQSGAADGLYGSIIFGNQTSNFSAITPTIATYANGAGYSINKLIQGPGILVPGFTDSTSASNPVDYALAFIGVDYYGFLVDNTLAPLGENSTPNTSCGFENPIQVAAIQGFLQNSKCFIASAAFRGDTAPLKLLRQFRGDFLEHFGLGRSFVHWYYAWSPNAAEWLIANPEFRYPVLLALIPLQILAWLILHPSVLTVLAMWALALMGFSVSNYRRKQEIRG
jgi:hypothetical protein